MPNYSMKCPSFRVILVCLILMVAASVTLEEVDQKLPELFVAKKNFLSRERDYLKAKPLSGDLRSFIKRYRRRTLGFSRKVKREEDELKDNVYVVKDGNIERLENISDVTANMPSSDPSGLGNFTVIPLIIPITVKTFRNATIGKVTQEGEDFPSTESVRELTDFDDNDDMKEHKRTTIDPNCITSNFTSASASNTTSNTTKTTGIIKHNATTPEGIVEEEFTSTTSQKLKFLNKVLSDVEGLISLEKEGRAPGSKEGAMCTVTGDWDSRIGGMQLQIETNNVSIHTPNVKIVPQEPEAESGFLKTGAWNVTSLLPFDRSSLIMFTAISEKSIAIFLGDCRICQGADTISGNWMLMEKSTNCKDRQEVRTFFSDVLSKNNVRKLQKMHLDEMSTMTVGTTEM